MADIVIEQPQLKKIIRQFLVRRGDIGDQLPTITFDQIDGEVVTTVTPASDPISRARDEMLEIWASVNSKEEGRAAIDQIIQLLRGRLG